MLMLPANTYASIDAKQNPALKKLTMPAWCSWVMILQVTIVYFFATVAKFYPGWLDGTFIKNLLARSVQNPFLHDIFTQKWFYLFIAYSGIAFDMLVVPLLLYRKTRTYALIASVIFHIFNSITLKIGIFPFFALSFVVFFYPPERIRAIFFKKKPQVTDTATQTYEYKNVLLYFFVPYFIIQLVLPLRHHFIKGDVLWTEEGHRLSWRMMLRSRNGYTRFRVEDKNTHISTPYDLHKLLTSRQKNSMETKPDMIWQMAQKVKEEYRQQGKDVAVYAETHAGVNGAALKPLIDPTVDLASVSWNYFGHDEWVLLYDKDGNLIK